MMNAELNRNRRLGCEFEMTVPLVGTGGRNDVQATLANTLSANGISAIFRSYSHDTIPDGIDVVVEYDSSVLGESRYNGISWHPIEVKTRILNGLDDWERIVPKTLEICRYMGARVNMSTGFHLHMELMEAVEKPTIIKSLYNLFFRFESVIFGLVAPSRSNNIYTLPILIESVQRLKGCKAHRSIRNALRDIHPKSGLNLTHLFLGNALSGNPRIEIRYHQGTLDPNKARHWVRFCLQMIQHACTRNCQFSAQVENNRQGLEKLLIACGFKVNSKIYNKVSSELRATGKYLINRWKKFNGAISLKECKSSVAKSTDAHFLHTPPGDSSL